MSRSSFHMRGNRLIHCSGSDSYAKPKRWENVSSVDCFRLRSGETSQTPYIVMEYCDAGNLTQFAGRSCDTPEARGLCSHCLANSRGLDQVHQMGILHRDIKPRNILFKSKPESETSKTTDSNRKTDSTDPPWHLLEAKLSDFGLAKVSGSESDSSKTQQGGMAGTPQYMSPEQ